MPVYVHKECKTMRNQKDTNCFNLNLIILHYIQRLKNKFSVLRQWNFFPQRMKKKKLRFLTIQQLCCCLHKCTNFKTMIINSYQTIYFLSSRFSNKLFIVCSFILHQYYIFGNLLYNTILQIFFFFHNSQTKL